MRLENVLVVGGSGFVGRHLAAALARHGIRTTVPTRSRDRAKHLTLLPAVDLVQADVYAPGVLERLARGCQMVVSLAGILHGRRGRADQRGPNDYGPDLARVHVELPQAIVRACRAAGVRRLLHVSAVGASPSAPSEYLRSKGIGEQAVLAADDLEATVFRPSVIFGPEDRFLNQFAQLAKVLPVLAIPAPRAKFKPVYVGDVANAMLACVNDPDTWGKVYELCGPQVYELKELVEYACELTGRKRLVLGMPDALAVLQARLFELLPLPPLTRDNLLSMRVPSTCEGQFPFGLQPQALEAIAPLYLAPRTTPLAPRERYPQLRWRARRSVLKALLTGPVRVINIGLSAFARDLAALGAPVAQVDWAPPAAGKPELVAALASLNSMDGQIKEANRQALERILAAEPVLADVQRAAELIPELAQERLMLHAGPPLAWERLCGPLRGAVCGAIVFEGWAADLAAAEKLAASGGVKFAPNHHYGAVGPMTGITTRSMPLLVVENRASVPNAGNRAFCALNEGLGKVMRFGGNDAEVLARLAWLRDEFAPLLKQALLSAGGVALNPLIARGLSMGDEMHQRNVACTSLLLRTLAPALARASRGNDALARAFDFIGGNDQFFLNVAMAMGKSVLDPARGIANSTVVTAMCRNGTDFGIRVAGLGDQWFTAPVEMPRGLYFPGFSAADANPDIGDSAILEAVGLGAFAMAAAPAVAGFVGAGGFREAVSYTRSMGEIALGRNAKWPIPALEFAGAPVGIDIRRVVETGIAPAINTGIAHRKAGVGQVGAGVARAPLACFEQALLAFQKR